MKRVYLLKAIFFILLFGVLFQLRAQETDFKQIMRCVFYNGRVYEKVFFEYKYLGITTFMEGYKQGLKGGFILPDTNIQRQYPEILDIVGVSHATEKLFMTMTLLSHPTGNTYVSSNILDGGILIWVNFDSFQRSKKSASINFHTSSLFKIDSLKDRYVRVACELKKKRRRWKIVSLKMEPIECCSRLW